MFIETHPSMFIETHPEENNKNLTFIKSANVQVYPCGRRRSTVIDEDGNKEKTTDDQYFLPFDPEARLNTEANNRKHSGLNGFTQTYLENWDKANNLLTLSLAGYLFNITLPSEFKYETASTPIDFREEDNFGTDIASKLADTAATKIYANILIEDVHLFSGFQEYFTGVLRNQSGTATDKPEISLDLLKSDIANATPEVLLAGQQKSDNFYFSGLSFSTSPLTGVEETRSVKKITPVRDTDSGKTVAQTQVSLCILEKVRISAEGETPEVWEWKIHQPALLPKIEHGETDDSIVVTGDALFKSNLKVEDNLTVEDKATVKEAEITDKTTITGELVVQNDDPAKAIFDNALVTGVLVATNPERNPDNPNYNPEAAPASIVADYAGIDDISAGTIEAEDIQQKIGEGENASYYNVPVIFLEPKTEDDKTFYQLQISRVNHKN